MPACHSSIETANAHDVLIIGGGNYFELWIEHSPTGASVAITAETFAKLNVPVFFNALGFDPEQEVLELSLARFKEFLNALLADRRFLVIARNDGALDNLRHYVGEEYADRLHRVPDGGFFYTAAGGDQQARRSS